MELHERIRRRVSLVLIYLVVVIPWQILRLYAKSLLWGSLGAGSCAKWNGGRRLAAEVCSYVGAGIWP